MSTYCYKILTTIFAVRIWFVVVNICFVVPGLLFGSLYCGFPKYHICFHLWSCLWFHDTTITFQLQGILCLIHLCLWYHYCVKLHSILILKWSLKGLLKVEFSFNHLYVCVSLCGLCACEFQCQIPQTWNCSCEWPDVGSGTQIQVLWKSNADF